MADLRSKSYIQVLDLVSEGEIVGLVDGAKSIFLNETPVENEDGSENFEGVTFDQRVGMNSQSPIDGFSSVENEITVSTEVTNATPVTRTITNSDVDSFRLKVRFPALYFTNNDGGVDGASVELAIDVQSADDATFVPQVIGNRYAGAITINTEKTATSNVACTGLEIGLTPTSSEIYGNNYFSDPTGNPVAFSAVVIEYKLTTDVTWQTAGVQKITAGVPRLRNGFPVGGTYVARTPSLPSGLYIIRITGFGWSITGGAANIGVASDIVSGRATGAYERDYTIPLRGSAPWTIRLRRITPDTTNIRLQDKTFFSSYTEIISAKLRYPNSALVALRFDSQQFGTVPRRAYDMKLLKVKVPSNYNTVTREYNGVWDGSFKPNKEWTNNPAWVFYDLLTAERYGLGGYVPESRVDKWALYTIAQYCDQLVPDGLGGTEPRFTCNLYLQGRQEAFKVVQDLASIFRGMVYWSSGSITATQDAPSDPVALYSPANVIDGDFTYSGTAGKARHTIALVSWNDPADFYRQKIEYVEDPEAIARFGVIETQITAMGCTSRGQANRVGRWLLFSEQEETETVSFRTGLEGALARPGHVIKVSDPTRAGTRYGGRVSSATTTNITLDAEVIPPPASELFVVLPDGTVENRLILSALGRVMTVSPPFSVAPQVAAAWIISSETTEAQTFRVISMQETEPGVVEITALKHEPAKYDAIELGLDLPDRNITEISIEPPPPVNVSSLETLYRFQSSVLVQVALTWDKVNGARSYRVQYRFRNGNFQTDETSFNDFTLKDAATGEYTFRIFSIGPTGIVSKTFTEYTTTVFGKTLPPEDVTGFLPIVDPSVGVLLSWNAVSDLDLQGYEIRRGATWATAEFVATVSATSYSVGEIPSGSVTYLIKALDTSGNYSMNAASATAAINAAAAPVVSVAFAGESAVLNWTAVRGSLLTEEYEIRYGASFGAGVSLGRIKGTTFATKAAWSGTRTFWVAAVDIAGNVGAAGSVDAVVIVPSAVTITQEVIDNNVLLRWGDATQTLEIESYELRRGATFAGAEVIGKVSARFSVIFEAQGGTYTYWIVGIDLAGNYGAGASTTVQVSQPPDYELKFNQDSVFGGTRSNIGEDSLGLVMPVNTSETYQAHFTTRSWSTPQDQVNAGFPIYIQPSAAASFYEEIVDYGTVIGSTKITASLDYVVASGTPVIVPTISVRELLTDPWTDYVGQSSAFATNFRYAKIRFDVTSTGGDDLIRVNGLNIRFDVKLKNDAGSGTANSADVGGTTVNFNIPFVDVTSITVTPNGTTAAIAVYDFVDAPNPTSFKVLLFNTAGTRISGGFSWNAKGV